MKSPPALVGPLDCHTFSNCGQRTIFVDTFEPSPPSHGRKRRTPAEAAGSGFGGAKLASKAYMPGKRKKGKKRKSRK